MRLRLGAAASIGLLAALSAAAADGASIRADTEGQMGITSAAATNAGEQEETRRGLFPGGESISPTEFPGIITFRRRFPSLGVVVEPHKALVTDTNPVRAETEVFFMRPTLQDDGQPPATISVGTADIGGGLVVAFTEADLSNFGTASIGQHPVIGETLFLVGYDETKLPSLAGPAKLRVQVVLCSGISPIEPNHFCFTKDNNLLDLDQDSIPIFNSAKELVGFYEKDNRITSVHVARSIASRRSSISSATPLENIPTVVEDGATPILLMLFFFPAGVCCCILSITVFVGLKRNANQSAELLNVNHNSPEALARRAQKKSNGLPALQYASDRRQMFVLPAGAPPPAGATAVGYLPLKESEFIEATAVPVGEYK